MLQTFVESYHYSTPFLRRHVAQARETGRLQFMFHCTGLNVREREMTQRNLQ